MKAEPLIIERTLQAPVSKVWKALTDARQMQSWYFDIAEFRAEPGFEFVFYGGDGQQQWAHYCRVLEAVKERKLSYTWKYDEWPDVETVVTFELFPEGESATRVKLTHDGVDGFPQDQKNFRKQSFTEGWTYIIGTSLTDYMEKPFIEHTLELKASPARVWQILTDKALIKQWAEAFSPGTYAETDWKVGSMVTWIAGDGTVGTKGQVMVSEPEKALRTTYYDELDSDQLGRYTEAYRLFPENGGTRLLISCGPLDDKYESIHRPLWEKAIAAIRQLAE